VTRPDSSPDGRSDETTATPRLEADSLTRRYGEVTAVKCRSTLSDRPTGQCASAATNPQTVPRAVRRRVGVLPEAFGYRGSITRPPRTRPGFTSLSGRVCQVLPTVRGLVRSASTALRASAPATNPAIATKIPKTARTSNPSGRTT